MIRHVFSGGADGVCREVTVQGGARCALPRDNSVHWNDDDHPFMPDGSDLYTACQWVKEDGEGVCGLSWRWHAVQGEDDGAETVVLEAVQEPVTEVLKVRSADEEGFGTSPAAEWGQGRVHPPDEDAEAGISLEWVETGALWRQASRALAGVGEWRDGPWPVRRWRCASAADMTVVYDHLHSLMVVGEDYDLVCQREHGGFGWWVAVTWGRFLGMTMPAVAEQIWRENNDGEPSGTGS